MDKALLPSGFHDLLSPDAGRKSLIMSRLALELYNFGYELVEPPVIEFENSLFTGAGFALKNQTFRLMDPVSHEMMGVRSDITTQVARIAVTRLKKSPKPLRLSYGGDVFRVKGEGLYAERQLTQSGIELVGTDNASADAEIVLVMVSTLKKLGVEGVCIDFTLPCLAGIILGNMGYSDNEKNALFDAINKKNIGEIESLAGKNSQILLDMASLNITIEKLQKLKLPSAAKPLCTRLAEVIHIIEASGEDIKISIDPLESQKFGYHTGIGFTIFVKNSRSEIGRGGRYEIDNNGKKIAAVGATIYINEILRILPVSGQKDKVFIPFGTDWQKIKELAQMEEKMVICASEKVVDIRAEAKRQGCALIFDGKKIIAV